VVPGGVCATGHVQTHVRVRVCMCMCVYVCVFSLPCMFVYRVFSECGGISIEIQLHGNLPLDASVLVTRHLRIARSVLDTFMNLAHPLTAEAAVTKIRTTMQDTFKDLVMDNQSASDAQCRVLLAPLCATHLGYDFEVVNTQPAASLASSLSATTAPVVADRKRRSVIALPTAASARTTASAGMRRSASFSHAPPSSLMAPSAVASQSLSSPSTTPPVVFHGMSSSVSFSSLDEYLDSRQKLIAAYLAVARGPAVTEV
jgi:hypothetical protein